MAITTRSNAIKLNSDNNCYNHFAYSIVRTRVLKHFVIRLECFISDIGLYIRGGIFCAYKVVIYISFIATRSSII